MSELGSRRFGELRACQIPVYWGADACSHPWCRHSLPSSSCLGVPALALGMLGVLIPPYVLQELPCPWLCSPLAQPVQGSLAGTCDGSSTKATSASSVLSCPLGFLGQGLSLLSFGFPIVWRLCLHGQGVPMGGFVLPNAEAAALEYTQGVWCWGTPSLALGLSWPSPALAQGGEWTRASCTEWEPRLLPTPCVGMICPGWPPLAGPAPAALRACIMQSTLKPEQFLGCDCCLTAQKH